MGQERTLHPAEQRHSLPAVQISVTAGDKLSLSSPNTPAGQPHLVGGIPACGRGVGIG